MNLKNIPAEQIKAALIENQLDDLLDNILYLNEVNLYILSKLDPSKGLDESVKDFSFILCSLYNVHKQLLTYREN